MVASLILAAAAFQAQPEGLLFDCAFAGPDSFRIFAPTGGDRRDVVRYEVRAPAGWAHQAPPQEVESSLPHSLVLTWRVENNSPVRLTISNLDLGAGTARFSLRYDLTPVSRRANITESISTCTVRPGDRSSLDQQGSQS